MAEKKKLRKVFSMTGFGAASVDLESLVLEVEVRTVNSRFLDLNFRLPRIYNCFESDLRQSIKKHFHRGRVEVYIQRTVSGKEAAALSFNRAVFEKYYSLYDSLLGEFASITDEAKARAVQDILNRREVLDTEESFVDSDKEKNALITVFEQALSEVSVMRGQEGETLNEDLNQRVLALTELVKKISDIAATAGDSISQRIEEKLKPFIEDGTIDANRLTAEAALISEKVDVSEELVRIKSHCEQWKKISQQHPQGRKFEFMLQELGREFNTIASKAQAADIQSLVVDAKSCLEKMREQAANIE